MATHKSALKAHRQSLKRRERNRRYRTRLRHALRDVRAFIRAGELEKARQALPKAVSIIDRLVSKGIIHANAGARYKSRLMKQLAASERAKAA